MRPSTLSATPMVLDRFRAALPQVRGWIEELLERHALQAMPVSSLGYPRLAGCLPEDLLGTAKVVQVPEVPFPPLTRMGLKELAEMEHRPLAAITYGDVFFVEPSELTESLCFHELVHVVQWSRLGMDRFLWAYGHGLLGFGYRDSPLERMAYELENAFKRGEMQWGEASGDLVRVIEKRTDAVWAKVVSALGDGD